MSKEYDERLNLIKSIYPRAYERWSEQEESDLKQLHDKGHSISAIANILQRQPSAISSRLARLDLMELPKTPTTPQKYTIDNNLLTTSEKEKGVKKPPLIRFHGHLPFHFHSGGRWF